MADYGTENTYSARIAAAIANELPKRVSLRNMARKELSEAILDIGRKVQFACDSPGTDWNVEECWRAFLGTTYELQLSIWGTERQCYGSIYYAFENFICELMAKLKGTPSYRMPWYKEFIADAKSVLPHNIVEECIGHPVVNAARLVRHALCHAGGKVTKELSGINHGIEVDANFIQVMANDNRKLIGELEWRAYKLADTTQNRLFSTASAPQSVASS